MVTTVPNGVTFTPDTLKKGTGGLGGLGNMAANGGKGADGMAAGCWDFSKNAACAP